VQADADGNGTIDYDEFITATMHMNRMDRDEHLYAAFQYFDKDNSGFITIEELEQALRETRRGPRHQGDHIGGRRRQRESRFTQNMLLLFTQDILKFCERWLRCRTGGSTIPSSRP
jgi:Ca2+-binding EF-hand superfamily protein